MAEPLLPRLGLRGPGATGVVLGLLLSAALLLAPMSLHPGSVYIGHPAHPDAELTVWTHWIVHGLGVGASHTRLQMFPVVADVLLLTGVPLDALSSWPFAAVFGWPAGYGIWQLALVWALGASTAALAARWWRSWPAGAVAGVAAQAGAAVLAELAVGRTREVFALVFVPGVLGGLTTALGEGRRRPALIAGLLLGVVLLSSGRLGIAVGIAALGLVALAALEGLPCLGAAAAFGAGVAAVTALPGIYAWSNLEHPAGEAGVWAVVRLGDPGTRLAPPAPEGGGLPAGMALTPVLYALMLGGVAGQRPRRWFTPVACLGLTAILAVGPVLGWVGSEPVPGPYALLPSLPTLRDGLWPDRIRLLAVPVSALLVAGGAARLLTRLAPPRRAPAAAALGALLLGEAALALPTLPLPVTPVPPSPLARRLTSGEGPVLILPPADAPDRPTAALFRDQLTHGRPLVNGLLSPRSPTAPIGYQEFSALPALAHLYGCDAAAAPYFGDATSAVAPLWRAGIREVVIDLDAVGAAADRYEACVASLLGPPTTRDPLVLTWTLRGG